MNKKLLIIILIIIIITIPYTKSKYIELNDLSIIESIGIYYDGKNYTIYLKEIIPLKDNNGIKFKYKYYKNKSNSINNALIKIKKNTNKKIYLNKLHSLITNITITNNIIKDLNINPKTIYHTKKVYKKLKSI